MCTIRSTKGFIYVILIAKVNNISITLIRKGPYNDGENSD